jgi:positive regulator of sigma E activity
LAFLGYGLPLFALLLGLWFGQTLAGDLSALFLGMSALLMTWLVVGKLGLVIEPKILDIHVVSV